MSPGDKNITTQVPTPVKKVRVWRRLSSIRRGRIQNLLALDQFKEVFNEKFFDQVIARIAILENRELKITTLVATLWLVLVISLLPIQVKYSLFGLTADSVKALREILLAMMSALGLFQSLTVRQQMTLLKEILRARDERISAKNDDAKHVLHIAHGLSPHWTPVPEDKLVIPSFWPLIIRANRDLFGVSLILTLAVGVIIVQLLIMREILERPNFNFVTSVFVVGFVVWTDLVVLLVWYARNGIYPYWDRTPNAQPVSILATIKLFWFLLKILWKARRHRKTMIPPVK